MKKLFWVSLSLLVMLSCQSMDEEILKRDYYNLARDFQLTGNQDRAEFYYILALDMPDPPLEIYYNLALIYIQTERFSEAERRLNKLENLDGGSRELLRLRLYLEMTRYDTGKAEEII